MLIPTKSSRDQEISVTIFALVSVENPLRGTQRLFSVKYVFGDANIA